MHLSGPSHTPSLSTAAVGSFWLQASRRQILSAGCLISGINYFLKQNGGTVRPRPQFCYTIGFMRCSWSLPKDLYSNICKNMYIFFKPQLHNYILADLNHLYKVRT